MQSIAKLLEKSIGKKMFPGIDGTWLQGRDRVQNESNGFKKNTSLDDLEEVDHTMWLSPGPHLRSIQSPTSPKLFARALTLGSDLDKFGCRVAHKSTEVQSQHRWLAVGGEARFLSPSSINMAQLISY